ncbi:MAG: hypothetical protein K1000chlam3_01420 [Chlamydiae bacterium]|nr:hypothetical protein [Chlamydiota bacterium]
MKLLGIGAKSRNLLAKVVGSTEGAITPSHVSEVLNIPQKTASILLNKWARRGWLRRIRRGWYISVPIESETSNIPIEDPWLIASQAFSPCYISGWSAAQHWDFTEQIFHTVVIMTTRHLDSRHQKIGEVKYLVKEIPSSKFFGTKTLWRGSLKIQVSDPTKTIIDVLDSPFLAGGIRPAADMLLEYLNSEHFDPQKLIIYAEKNGNKTVFKRLGFLIERMKPELYDLIIHCKERISKGYSQLDPSLKEKKINTRWRLRIPKNDYQKRDLF